MFDLEVDHPSTLGNLDHDAFWEGNWRRPRNARVSRSSSHTSSSDGRTDSSTAPSALGTPRPSATLSPQRLTQSTSVARAASRIYRPDTSLLRSMEGPLALLVPFIVFQIGDFFVPIFSFACKASFS